jgi:preprotein translocase subunit SecG
MYTFLLILFLFCCFAMVIVILLQSSKGGGLAGAFGGGGDMGAVFGGRGAANFLSKSTSWLACAFMVLAIVLSLVSRSGSNQPQSLLQQEQQEQGSVPAAGLPMVPAEGTSGTIPGAGSVDTPVLQVQPDSAAN